MSVRGNVPKYRVEDNGCWTWLGAVNHEGYGLTSRALPGGGIRRNGTHRFYWEDRYGPIPEGLQINHLCKNRRCLNTDHMELVTVTGQNRDRSCNKLNIQKAREIRASNEPGRLLAKRYGVSESLVSQVRNRHLWKEEEQLKSLTVEMQAVGA